MPILRRLQISALLWLLTVVIVCLAAPLGYRHIQFRRMIAKHRDEYKRLAADIPYRGADGRGYEVLIFIPVFGGFPGSNPQTVVVTDKFFGELSSTIVYDGQSKFDAAVVEYVDGAPFLAITRVYRPMYGGIGTSRYALNAAGVVPAGDVQWNDRNYWERYFASLFREAGG